MKRKLKDLESNHFPNLETKKFEQWKNARISFNKKYPIYFFGTFLVLFLIVLVTTGNFLIGGAIPFLVAWFVARGVAGRNYFEISKELGITEKNVIKLLQGKVDFIETSVINNSNVTEKSKLEIFIDENQSLNRNEYNLLKENEKDIVHKFINYGIPQDEILVINNLTREVTRFDNKDWERIVKKNEETNWTIIVNKS